MDFAKGQAWLLAYAMICLPLMSEQFVLAMPGACLAAMREDGELGLSAALAGVLGSFGTALNAAGKLAGGPLIDRFGARRFLLVSMPLMALGAAAFGAVPSRLGPLVGYIVLQLCAAGGWLSACKLIEQNFDQERWVGCFSLLGVASRLGAVGSKLGLGLLLKALPWRQVALLTAAAMAAGSVAAAWLLPSSGEHRDGERATNGARQAERPTGRLLDRLPVIALDPGMALTSLAAVCLYSQCGSMDSLAPLLLQDTTELDAAGVSMASAAFPAGLGAALLVAAPVYANMGLRRWKFAFELSLQALGLMGALMALAAVWHAGMAPGILAVNVSMPIVIVVCLFLLSFGGGLTYYVTLNMYPLTFGEDCATASALLDVVGLISSTVFQLVAGVIFHNLQGEGGRQSWTIILLILSALVLVAMVCTLILWHWPSLTRDRAACDDQELKAASCDTEHSEPTEATALWNPDEGAKDAQRSTRSKRQATSRSRSRGGCAAR
ncbi:unnamed protein product [Prorocentrum cordatum]|uniref:Major facilitator superfamily (MFS) profile domain-containing protein n=1 Tax=Prorocentrum cordatum TaxID=2364126 RepID=A0ABN9VXK3_9DINO|nr:unnamed protein product [Polarella glacialis]